MDIGIVCISAHTLSGNNGGSSIWIAGYYFTHISYNYHNSFGQMYITGSIADATLTIEDGELQVGQKYNVIISHLNKNYNG